MISILKNFCFLCVMTCDNPLIMKTDGLSDLHFSNLINIVSLFYFILQKKDIDMIDAQSTAIS